MPPPEGAKCHPCVRNTVLPPSQEAHHPEGVSTRRGSEVSREPPSGYVVRAIPPRASLPQERHTLPAGLVTVASFADAEQRRFPAGGFLQGHEPQPRRQVSSFPKRRAFADCGDERRRAERAKSRNLDEPLARGVRAGDRGDLASQLPNAVLEQAPLRSEPLDDQSHRGRQG